MINVTKFNVLFLLSDIIKAMLAASVLPAETQ